MKMLNQQRMDGILSISRTCRRMLLSRHTSDGDTQAASVGSWRSFLSCPDLEPRVLPRIDGDELQLGQVLGKGSFCVVSKIKNMSAASNNASELDDTLRFGRNLASRPNRPFKINQFEGSGDDYSLKRVRPELRFRSPSTYTQALDDLTFEAELLSMMQHPKIISICGVSDRGASDFIVLERLEETLAQRAIRWARLDRQSKRGFLSPTHKQLIRSYEDRIGVALDLASVLEYLHRNKIVYRDLKPANIGFTFEGEFKLFDFGMATKLSPDALSEDGIHYHLTGMTGTIRFMAPEVGKSLPYDASADIYSFSMILWYLLQLQVPFGADCSVSTILEDVFEKGLRPPINESWSEPLKDLLVRAWDSDTSQRGGATCSR